ncbi:hypothetical protein [Streptomyces sp. NPDC005141]
MGPEAAPALPLIRAELVLARRGGRFKGVEQDEELRRIGRVILTRLA